MKKAWGWRLQMKKLVFGIVGLTALLAAPAMAADLAAGPVVKAPPRAEPVYSKLGRVLSWHPRRLWLGQCG